MVSLLSRQRHVQTLHKRCINDKLEYQKTLAPLAKDRAISTVIEYLSLQKTIKRLFKAESTMTKKMGKEYQQQNSGSWKTNGQVVIALVDS